jgi:hypothetical protein
MTSFESGIVILLSAVICLRPASSGEAFAAMYIPIILDPNNEHDRFLSVAAKGCPGYAGF